MHVDADAKAQYKKLEDAAAKGLFFIYKNSRIFESSVFQKSSLLFFLSCYMLVVFFRLSGALRTFLFYLF